MSNSDAPSIFLLFLQFVAIVIFRLSTWPMYQAVYSRSSKVYVEFANSEDDVAIRPSANEGYRSNIRSSACRIGEWQFGKSTSTIIRILHVRGFESSIEWCARNREWSTRVKFTARSTYLSRQIWHLHRPITIPSQYITHHRTWGRIRLHSFFGTRDGRRGIIHTHMKAQILNFTLNIWIERIATQMHIQMNKYMYSELKMKVCRFSPMYV